MMTLGFGKRVDKFLALANVFYAGKYHQKDIFFSLVHLFTVDNLDMFNPLLY